MEWRFGIKIPEAEYRQRPGVYAVIFDEQGRFAAVRGRRSDYFLPGGGAEPGESLEETLAREVREECACKVVIGRFLGNAIQFFITASGKHYELCGSYFEARFGAPLTIESEHDLCWLEVAEARTTLLHEAHAWAVEQAVSHANIIF